MPLFPDAVRHAIARQAVAIEDYSIRQHETTFQLAVNGDDRAFDSIRYAVDDLIAVQGMKRPAWKRVDLDALPPAAKRRRIVCVTKPSPNAERHASTMAR